ncbi:P-loop NTPase fold protein [Psychrobacter sp. AOP7-A1-24]|uniref:P-loop NTPase fold protein n=1 Tax=Psychrobacter sp. AOP7-A1-24 TaxID=3457646 RepID=UPI00402BC3A9
MSDSSNPNDHIESFLNYYFNLEAPPHYAVLLKGPWGVGKTWFLKKALNSLSDSKSNTKKYLYVSLYGITSFKEIEDEFFRELYPLLSSKGVAIAGKLTKSALGFVRIKAPEIEMSEYLTKTEGLILVFDDLERASIDLESLLGYINYFVEHKDNKVILIANENEILTKKNGNEEKYFRIKEKLIGKTFEVEPQFELAIDNFKKEVKPEKIQVYIEDNLSLIKEYYGFSSYQNLRHLRQALMDFARLIEIFPDEITKNKEVVSHILSIFLLLSFEIKSGNIFPKDISNFQKLHYMSLMEEGGDKAVNVYKEIRIKYLDFNYQKLLLDSSLWIEIFDKGMISKDKIINSIHESKYFKKDTRENWVKLWNYIELNDNEFDTLLKSVLSDFDRKIYTKIGIVKHITGLFLLFSDINLINKGRDEILADSKMYVDSLIEKDILLYDDNDDGFLDKESWAGLGYHQRDTAEFEYLYKYIEAKKSEQKISKYPDLANNLLVYMKQEVRIFYQKVANPSEDIKYSSIPILKYIEPKDFVTTFLNIHPENWQIIIQAIKSRYDTSSLYFFSQELNWLKTVVCLLDAEVSLRKGKISGYQLDSFIRYTLIPSITKLEKSVLKSGKWKFNKSKNNNFRAMPYSVISRSYYV